MSLLRLLLAFSLAIATAPLAAASVAALTSQAAGSAAERETIARILDADNVDVAALSPREVATRIAAIPRGDAPEDFWAAYQAHVRAWRRSAEAGEKLASIAGGKRGDADRATAEAGEAMAAIVTTFDEVERIAARYGVPMPVPPRLQQGFDPDSV